MASDRTILENLPSFSTINFTEITAQLQDLLQENRKSILALLKKSPQTWDDLLQELMLIDNKLNSFWSPIQHLQGVANSEALRSVYPDCLAMLTAYRTELAQHQALQQAFHRLYTGDTFKCLDKAQQKVITDALRDFHLAGVDLPDSQKTRYREMNAELAELTTQFENNLLDATQDWRRYIHDPRLIAGLPETALAHSKLLARQENFDGWILTLDFPCYFAVMSYVDNPILRHEIYTAYITRASELGSNKDWDNSKIMIDILRLRDEEAKLLGFNHYAEFSLASKMAKTPEQVLTFLHDLLADCKPYAERDYKELYEFVNHQFGITELHPWDIAYYSERLKEHRYHLSQETLRPYFPLPKVLTGLFHIAHQLYGIHVEAIHDIETWHPDVMCYKVYDSEHRLRGICYLDLYTRNGKRSGAWMDSYCQRFRLRDGSIQAPVAFIICNFSNPTEEHPALLTHDDVITLFHEFGHGFHHLLTMVDYADVSGIAGVPWDAVELPSQFFENWCWQQPALTFLSQHIKTGETLPDTLFKQLLEAKNFQAGIAMVRQIEFALFDIQIHMDFDASDQHSIQTILDNVRQLTSVLPIADFNRFQHSFGHIFAGGYAAGYYSYLWAEVLSSDAFSKFEETGVFNSTTGREFLTTILEQGGSKDPLELFEAFRGRAPTMDALLKHSGFTSKRDA